MEIKRGALVAIVGDVGSGKSSVFNSFLGEMIIDQGNKPELILNGDIAYVSQKPWIQNDTLKNNILFGNPYIKSKLEEVLSVCC